MNQLYWKYRTREGREYFYRVGMYGDKRFIPEKNEVIIGMKKDKLDGSIYIGDGRRSIANLTQIENIVTGNSFIVLPHKINGEQSTFGPTLRTALKTANDLMGRDDIDEDAFWKSVDLISEFTDIPVDDNEERPEYLLSLVQKFIIHASKVIFCMETGEYETEIDPEYLIPEECKISKQTEITNLDKCKKYLPDFKEVVIVRPVNFEYFIFIGDGQHTLEELDLLKRNFFKEHCSTMMSTCILPDYLFDYNLRSILKEITFKMHSASTWGNQRYNEYLLSNFVDQLSKYTDVDTKNLNPVEFVSLIKQMIEVQGEIHTMIGWVEKIKKKGGYEY